MTIESDQRLARNLAEVIEQLYDIERQRERRIDLIAHHYCMRSRLDFAMDVDGDSPDLFV
jgi:hypothetical protein